jgi:hypothetical protein
LSAFEIRHGTLNIVSTLDPFFLINFSNVHIQRLFAKFVDSPYYSKSEICGGAVTVSFKVPPLAGDALLTMLHPLLKNMLQTIDHFEISCLGGPFSWLEKPRNYMGRDLDCMADVLMRFH